MSNRYSNQSQRHQGAEVPNFGRTISPSELSVSGANKIMRLIGKTGGEIMVLDKMQISENGADPIQYNEDAPYKISKIGSQLEQTINSNQQYYPEVPQQQKYSMVVNQAPQMQQAPILVTPQPLQHNIKIKPLTKQKKMIEDDDLSAYIGDPEPAQTQQEINDSLEETIRVATEPIVNKLETVCKLLGLIYKQQQKVNVAPQQEVNQEQLINTLKETVEKSTVTAINLVMENVQTESYDEDDFEFEAVDTEKLELTLEDDTAEDDTEQE